MDKQIYLCLAHMSKAGLEQKYVKEAFDTNWVVPLGPNVNAFEEDLKQFTGGTHEVVALSAGTAAVHLALIACGVGPGDPKLMTYLAVETIKNCPVIAVPADGKEHAISYKIASGIVKDMD